MFKINENIKFFVFHESVHGINKIIAAYAVKWIILQLNWIQIIIKPKPEMLRFSGFLKNISIIAFTLSLLIVYAFLQKNAGILFDKNGHQLISVSKNQFFYYLFFTGFIINLLFYLFRILYLKKTKTVTVSKSITEIRITMITSN